MSKAMVRSGLEKTVFLLWLSLSIFVMIGLLRTPLPTSVAETSTDSATSTNITPSSQTLGAVQDIVGASADSTDNEQQSPPNSDYEPSGFTQPDYFFGPPSQPAQQTSPAESDSHGHQSEQSQSLPQENQESEALSATSIILMCVPGVLCI